MHTPAPQLLPAVTFAERFWAHARGPELEDVPEPLRSIGVVRHFLAAIDRIDATSPRKAAPALVGMLRQSELEGDLSYASPEQLRGEILDTRSVVFSLGVVLFERLTGRHPFGAENNRPRRIDRIRRGEMGSGVNSFPTVAAGLRSVLVRAMSPFPEERWPDLRQMRELLAQFVAQEAPAPRLPGTLSEVEPAGEQTRIVRRATDFGRELMQVVARHDVTPNPAPRREPSRPGVRTSQRVAVPAAGVAAVTGATAPPPRRPSQRTPSAGVHLRAVPPPVPGPAPAAAPAPARAPSPAPAIQPAVAIDPLGETMRMPPARDAAPRDPAPASDPSRPPTPGPFPRPPTPRPALTLPLAAPPESPLDAIDLRPRRRTTTVAVVSAAAGAVAALALVFALRSAPPHAAASAAHAPDQALPSLPAAPPALPSAAPAAAPADDVPAAPAAEPAATRATAPPPADPARAAGAAAARAVIGADGDAADALAGAVASCLAPAPGARLFGLSPVVKDGAIGRAYLGGAEALSPTERGCISRAVRGLPHPGPAGVVEYKVRADAHGVTVTAR